MAHKGIGYFDSKGHFFKSPEEATVSDIAAILGKIGDGESLAPGIAHTLLSQREDIERLFAEHDTMLEEHARLAGNSVVASAKIAKLPRRRAEVR